MDFEQHRAQLGFLSLRGSVKADLRDRDAKLLRDCPDRLRESDVLDLLDKGENIAGNAASEAMEKLPRGMHGERRSLLSMKRTQPGIVLRTSLPQLDVVADDPNDVGLLLNRVCEIARIGHGGTVVQQYCEAEKGFRNYTPAELVCRSCGSHHLADECGGKPA